MIKILIYAYSHTNVMLQKTKGFLLSTTSFNSLLHCDIKEKKERTNIGREGNNF